MNPQFRVIVIGGTGQVGSAVVHALLAESVCREVVMVTRKPAVISDPARLRNAVMDTGAADFEMRVADLARLEASTLNLPITETIDEVIVYHADRLHVGIHDRRTNETESATLKVLAERVGCGRSRRNLSHGLPSVVLCPSVNEAPAIGVEASELFLDFEKGARVAHGGLDLHAIADDLGIQYELLDSPSGKSRDFLRIKSLESAPITLPLLQYYRPAQPSLRTFEHEKLEVPAVIVDWDSPLAIMVLEHQRIIGPDPRAPLDVCGCAAHEDRGLLFLTKL